MDHAEAEQGQRFFGQEAQQLGLYFEDVVDQAEFDDQVTASPFCESTVDAV